MTTITSDLAMPSVRASFFHHLSAGVIRIGLSILCRVHTEGLERVPPRGPLIVISNHTGSLEVPLLFAWLHPRPMTGWAKIESWKNPFLAWLFDRWGAIPVRRGESDLNAMRIALERLKQGYIFGLAPEGTRNKTGRLLRARAGAVALALWSGAPVLPIAHWGGEHFRHNLKRLRRTEIFVRVGRPFVVQAPQPHLSRDERQHIADEMMYQLAALLPEAYRGAYSDLSQATTTYLRFLDEDPQPDDSNR